LGKITDTFFVIGLLIVAVIIIFTPKKTEPKEKQKYDVRDTLIIMRNAAGEIDTFPALYVTDGRVQAIILGEGK
jgi:hypothetical protein